MTMNWKLRLKNKVTLTAIILAFVTFIYQVCGLLGIVPAISQDDIVNIAGIIINIMVAVGVVVDPTTSGFGDSKLAMTYETPKVDPAD